MPFYVAECGDVLMVGRHPRKAGWLNRKIINLIAWATRGKGEPRTFAIHAAIAADEFSGVESTSPCVREFCWAAELERLTAEGRPWAVFRPKDRLTPAERARVRNYLDAMVGTVYAFGEYPCHFLDGMLEKVTGRPVFVFRRLIGFIRNAVCSGLVGRALWLIQRLGDEAFMYSPDDLMDEMVRRRWPIMAAGGAPLNSWLMHFWRKHGQVQRS
jgi:hypothetical protein